MFSKKRQMLLLSSVLILMLILSGCGPKDRNSEAEDTENETATVELDAQNEIFYVKSERVAIKTFSDDLLLPGKAEPIQTVVIASKTSGDVESAPYDIGDTVEEGTLLLTLDDQDHKISSSQASLGLTQAEITLKTAKDNLAKNKLLYENGAISQTQLEAFENAYKNANIGYKTAKNNFESATINLNNTTIESPITGIISSKDFAIGENISPGKPVYTVVNIDQVNVIVGVPEQYILGLKEGQEVVLTAQYGANTWSGKIINISPVMDDRGHTYTTKILVNNEDHSLRAGMSVEVEVLVSQSTKSLGFNKLGLILKGDRPYVYINDKGFARLKPVEIGASSDDYYQIIDGLTLDDEVITEGSGMLEDGDVIEIKN